MTTGATSREDLVGELAGPAIRWSRWTGRVVWALFLVLFALAAFVPISSGVVAVGQLAPASSRQVVQHPTGGVISEILVEEGDEVRAGDVLVRFAGIEEQATAGISDAEIFALHMEEAVRAAEAAGQSSFVPPGLLVSAAKTNAELEAILGSHQVAFEARQARLVLALDQIDASLHAAGRRVFCCYDALDRISPFNGHMRRRHIRVLLSLWSSLSSRHRSLRAKVFLRDDLLDPKALEFPDASKLRARSASLRWSHEDLSRLIVRYLAQDGEAVLAWLRRIKQLELRPDPRLGWLPGAMPEAVRTAFTNSMTGNAIGTGIFRVEPGRWIVGRLQDAKGEISPRTTLRFFGYAGLEGLHRAREQPSRSPILLSDRDLAASIRLTSRDRVTELREEYEIVNRMENLSDLTIPIPRAEAERRLARPAALEVPRGEYPGDAVLEELERLGVVSEYGNPDARVLDVPDIYRYGFGIGVDYSEAFRSYIMNGPAALSLLQRGDLPQLDVLIAKADHDGSLILGAIKGAWERYLSGNAVAAMHLLETALDLAKRKNDPEMTFQALFFTSEVYLSFAPDAALAAIAYARALLNADPLPAQGRREAVLAIQECCALISLHRTEQARTAIDALSERAEAQDPELRDNLSWIRGQLALLSGDTVEAARYAAALVEAKYEVQQWRGYLLAASLVMMRGRAPKDCLGSAHGMLPWALSLDGLSDSQLRTAARLAYLPACAPDADDIVRKGAEQIASAYVARIDGLTLDELRVEAGQDYARDQGRELFAAAIADLG